MMKKLLITVVALPFLTGIAMAGQSRVLSDKQMDKVTAGDDTMSVCHQVCAELENFTGVSNAALAAAAATVAKSTSNTKSN
jgi:hypothetical protein